MLPPTLYGSFTRSHFNQTCLLAVHQAILAKKNIALFMHYVKEHLQCGSYKHPFDDPFPPFEELSNERSKLTDYHFAAWVRDDIEFVNLLSDRGGDRSADHNRVH